MRQRRQINRLEPVTGDWRNFVLNFLVCCGWLFKWIFKVLMKFIRKG